MNACNRINDHQQNKPVEKWDILKRRQINKLPKKFTITNSY